MKTNLKVGDVVQRIDWSYSYEVTKKGLVNKGCEPDSPCQYEKWVVVAFHSDLPTEECEIGRASCRERV